MKKVKKSKAYKSNIKPGKLDRRKKSIKRGVGYGTVLGTGYAGKKIVD